MLLRATLYLGPDTTPEAGDLIVDPNYVVSMVEWTREGVPLVNVAMANSTVWCCWDRTRDLVRRWAEATGNLDPEVAPQDLLPE